VDRDLRQRPDEPGRPDDEEHVPDCVCHPAPAGSDQIAENERARARDGN
jgi:hypothetical protein